MSSAIVVASPVPGTVVAMTDVPDQVFAGLMVGPGIAVLPGRRSMMEVVAPCDGAVVALYPHAFVVDAGEGRGVLVHVGIDTVSLGGHGFTLHVGVGDEVHAGDRLITWSPVEVAAAGLPTVCPVVALQGDASLVRCLVEPGMHVVAGDPLLEWDGAPPEG